jgi:CDP-diacylglycerol--serine O-phosphatidyltransferase
MTRWIPSAITLAGMAAALVAMLWAPGHPLWACNAIIVAALCDMIDGRVARMLDAQSSFGKELDSLVDVVAFGVAPRLLAYQTGLGDLGAVAGVPIGLAPLALYVGAAAVRLARFNAMPSGAGESFVGIPTPVAALLVTTPIMASDELALVLPPDAALRLGFVVGAALLMVVPVRFPSFKRFDSRVVQALYFGAMIAGVAMLLLDLPGGTVLLGCLAVYLARGIVGLVRA